MMMTKKKVFAQYDKQQILSLLRQAYEDNYFLRIVPSEVVGKDKDYLVLLIRSMAHSHNMTLLARRRLLEKLFDITSRYEYLLKKFLYLESTRTTKVGFSHLHVIKNAAVKEADKVLRLEMMKQIREEKA
jgi:hypothetical protein